VAAARDSVVATTSAAVRMAAFYAVSALLNGGNFG
jgi:hypothetical protein